MRQFLHFKDFRKGLPVAYWKVFLSAVLISLFFILQEYANHLARNYTFAFSWLSISQKIIFTYLLWALLYPLVWWFANRLSFRKTTEVLKTFVFGVGLAMIHQVLLVLLVAVGFRFGSGRWQSLFSSNEMAVMLVSIFSSMVQLAFFSAILMFFDYYRKYLEKQKELNSAQLYALKMKLHPHFLFNTLHAISSMIDYNQEGAQKMLTRLGSLFRTILENEEQQTVSLEEELKYIRDYLDIEQVRFEEQLQFSFDVASDTLDARVPSLILQPLVENSIKHGISKMKTRGCIKIMSEKVKSIEGADRVALTISDNGQGLGSSRQSSFGIGIKNVNDRLFRLYQENFEFQIKAGEEQGTVARIEIPYLQKT